MAIDDHKTNKNHRLPVKNSKFNYAKRALHCETTPIATNISRKCKRPILLRLQTNFEFNKENTAQSPIQNTKCKRFHFLTG